ncbi:MAG: methyltransferase domain-containing protein [Acidobacteriota bacterium]
MESEPVESAISEQGEKRLDFSQRALPSELPEWMDGPHSPAERRGYLGDLELINRLLLGYRPILNWLDALLPRMRALGEPVRVLDVGCGFGDTLRRIARWAKSNSVAMELTGLDLSAETAAIAAERTEPGLRIRYVAADVFAYTPEQQAHLVVSSLFTHHLEDAEIVRFLRWMEEHAAIGWCINDLSRHPVPYTLFRWFASMLRLHPFVRHDGPVSIARAFRDDDWQRYCAAAGLNLTEVQIRGFTPGRLRVSRNKR